MSKGVLSHMNESCHIWKVTSHNWQNHDAHLKRVISHTYLHIPVTQMAFVPPRKVHPMWKCHVTRSITSWFTHTYESTNSKDNPKAPPKVQPIPLGVTFSNAVSKLKAQSSNVSFATFQGKETFELWALSFERAFEIVTPRGIGCMSHMKKSCHPFHKVVT